MTTTDVKKCDAIIFCDIRNVTGVDENDIVQHEPLEFQKISNSGFILRTRMEHSKEYIQQCKQQILENQQFKQAINTIFGTTDLNKLHSISQSVIQIKKYVDGVYENIDHSGGN